jgi:hypothetical protein
MAVKHDHQPVDTLKMDGQAQTVYPRKNWSSLVLWNCGHPAHNGLTLERINGLPGRDLHRFCWLNDDEIGELPLEWNWLEGSSDPVSPIRMIHYTRGGPWMSNWRGVQYADLWLRERSSMLGRNVAHCAA